MTCIRPAAHQRSDGCQEIIRFPDSVNTVAPPGQTYGSLRAWTQITVYQCQSKQRKFMDSESSLSVSSVDTAYVARHGRDEGV